jgi:hypothetical protein
VIYINNAVFSGFMRVSKDCQSGFVGVNTVGDPKADPVAAANAAADTSEPRLIEIVRAAAGVPDLPVKIVGLSRWRASTDVAQRFQQGRVFLAGDAAHLMPPNGGFGGNTGIHDAHNLAWKLAFVLRGAAGPGLLDTYETERRPVSTFTVEQAYTRYVTRTAPYLGKTDFAPLVSDFDIELGYMHRSAAVMLEDQSDRAHADPHGTRAVPGSRAPHLWIVRAGAKISTLDLFGESFVLLAGSHGGAWRAAAHDAAAAFARLPLEVCESGADFALEPGRFEQAYDVSSSGAVLVRPDGFVAWRSRTAPDDPVSALRQVFERVLMRGPSLPERSQ